MKLTLAFALMTTPALAAPALAEGLPGYDRFDLNAAHRARPVAASIWYPAAAPTYSAPVGDGPLFQPQRAFVGAAVAPGHHALVLLSHGSGGNADSLGWLSAGLAVRGAIVVAVNHPGSTSGDSSPRQSVDLAARAQDLSAALDAVLADPGFAGFVDPARVSAVGFSLGGTTALGLGGLQFDGAMQQANCQTGPDAADCGFFLRGGVDFAAAKGFDADTRDRRVTRAVAIDPGFVGAVATDSPSAVPVHFINLGEGPDRLGAVDVGPDGYDLAGRLPGASYQTFAPANHFSFLAECKPGSPEMLKEEGDDPICTDPAGTDRAALHQALIANIGRALGL